MQGRPAHSTGTRGNGLCRWGGWVGWVGAHAGYRNVPVRRAGGGGVVGCSFFSSCVGLRRGGLGEQRHGPTRARPVEGRASPPGPGGWTDRTTRRGKGAAWGRAGRGAACRKNKCETDTSRRGLSRESRCLLDNGCSKNGRISNSPPHAHTPTHHHPPPPKPWGSMPPLPFLCCSF